MADLTNTIPDIEVAEGDAASGARGLPVSLLAGGVFVLLGAAFVIFGLDYRLGDLRSMGPGMFPVAAGTLLLLLGTGIAVAGRKGAERLSVIAFRPLAAITASVLVFALLIERAGIVIAAPLLIAGVVLATGQGSWKFALAVGAPLTVASVVIFPVLLGVPLKVLP